MIERIVEFAETNSVRSVNRVGATLGATLIFTLVRSAYNWGYGLIFEPVSNQVTFPRQAMVLG